METTVLLPRELTRADRNHIENVFRTVAKTFPHISMEGKVFKAHQALREKIPGITADKIRRVLGIQLPRKTPGPGAKPSQILEPQLAPA